MRFLVLVGLVALVLSASAQKRDKKFRKFFPLKDKRGTDFQGFGPGGGSSSFFRPISPPSSNSLAHSDSYGFDSIGRGAPLSSLGPSVGSSLGSSFGSGHGLSLSGLNFGHGQSVLTLPLSSTFGKTGPVTFGSAAGAGYSSPLYASPAQALSSIGSGSHGAALPLLSLGSHGLSLPASTGAVGSPSHVSGGLVFADSSQYSAQGSSPSYHVGLSSGSPDSSSYQLPISSNSYSAESGTLYSKYQPPASSSASTYALPSTSYGTPTTNYFTPSQSSPTVHYSPPASYSSSQASYNDLSSGESSGSSYSPSSSYSSAEYPSYSQVSSQGSGEQQSSYTHVSPMYQVAVRNYNGDESHKYDTISYSGPSGKY